MICKTFGECFLVDLQSRLTNVTIWKAFCLSLRESRVLAVILMRISQYLFQKRFIWRIVPYLQRANEILTGFECSHSAIIGEGLFIAHTQNTVIGEGVKIGKRVTIYNGVTLGAAYRGAGKKNNQYPVIEDDVIIYTGAKIIGPVRIGKEAVIGANAVVFKDVPPKSIAVGVPARILIEKKNKKK